MEPQEADPLVPADGSETIWQLGFEIDDDSSQAHYVLVFPNPTEEDKGKALALPKGDVKTPEDAWKKIFVDNDTANPPKNLASMTTQTEFSDAVRERVMDILQGECCGFTCTAYKSADGLNLVVRILLQRESARIAIAEQEAIRVKLRQDAYTNYDQQLPRDAFKAGEFIETAKIVVDHVQLSKKTETIADLNWREVDLIRMVRRRMNTFIDPDMLIEFNVAADCFPSHTYEDLKKLHDTGWNNWKAIFQWPGTQHVDVVRDYFGEEIGFFFHWLNFFTRYLVVAGCIGGVVSIITNFVLEEDDDDVDADDDMFKTQSNFLVWPHGNYHRSYLRLIFTLFMCLWGAVYTKHYQQRSNFKIMEWGMKDYSNAAKVRPKYDHTYRGSVLDTLQRYAHWVLVLFFVLETIIVVFLVSNLRAQLSDMAIKGTDPLPPLTFGVMTGKKVCPLLITANIKIVDQLWKRISPALTERENWRTDQELKNSKVIKMFMVKFVVYYYPFLFIAFLQEHWQDDATPDTCLEELKQQIYVYFPVEVAFTIGITCFELVKTKWILEKRLGGIRKIYHTELQAMSPSYEDGIEDTMELILGFGFLMMFTTSVTAMPLLALLSNLVQIRLIAYRLSFANQRVPPRGQEGFGAWADIVQVITFVGVLVNVGEAAFVMKPFRGLPPPNKLTWFLLFEHLLLMLKLFITAAVPSIADNQKFIEEHNSTAVEIIRWRCRQDQRPTAGGEAGTTSRTSHGLADTIDVDDKIPRVNLKDERTWERND